ncbi:hypothetical protein D3C81_2209570 [compost metagenome]
MTYWCTSTALASITAIRCARAGSSCSCTAKAALTWMVVGMMSLLLWPQLTWSLALTASPSTRLAKVAITSLAFMFELVPEPVW